ncbi:hypothetical protein Halxa_0440 (plasmid) [Halopiger xanaduensis SH-6]|uniref:Uncharacterized protein n=1 Tax=Halopiger xanaduensis (strain DSM 18323 / JCM 14033 / SH-6) TaxID=797210 RepID=F8DE04_HALXS|nr:hypothetical protein Halxa_0440 [Halopiger xanaduensis SH-6]
MTAESDIARTASARSTCNWPTIHGRFSVRFVHRRSFRNREQTAPITPPPRGGPVAEKSTTRDDSSRLYERVGRYYRDRRGTLEGDDAAVHRRSPVAPPIQPNENIRSDRTDAVVERRISTVLFVASDTVRADSWIHVERTCRALLTVSRDALDISSGMVGQSGNGRYLGERPVMWPLSIMDVRSLWFVYSCTYVNTNRRIATIGGPVTPDGIR